MYRWKVAWLQGLIVDRVKSDEPDPGLRCKLLLYFCGRANHNRAVDVADAAAAVGGKKRKKANGYGYLTDVSLYGTLQTAEDDRIPAIAWNALETWLGQSFEGYNAPIEPEAIEGIAADLGITLDDWELTSDFLELHSKDQLAALVKEWKLKPPPARNAPVGWPAKRADLIAAILEAGAGVDAPKELATLKPVRLM